MAYVVQRDKGRERARAREGERERENTHGHTDAKMCARDMEVHMCTYAGTRSRCRSDDARQPKV